jgi:hypothetical protein
MPPISLWELANNLSSMIERLNGLDRLTDAKFVTHRTLLDSQAEKVALALAAAKEAINKAEAATEKRFQSVNEFRETLSDQAATFVNRDQFEALRDVVATLSARLDRIEGRTTGLSAGWGYLLGAVGLAGGVIGIVIAVGGGGGG